MDGQCLRRDNGVAMLEEGGSDNVEGVGTRKWQRWRRDRGKAMLEEGQCKGDGGEGTRER